MDSRLSKCLAMQERAKKHIPGMTQLLSKRPDMFSLGVWPGYYQKAEGAYVWDLDGNKYLDMSISGIGANVLGYSDPDVDAAVLETIKNGNSCSLNCPEEVALAETLCKLHPWADMVRFARTGGEAMAMAVRIARAHTGRDTVAFCGYHGWHDWYLSANLEVDNALQEHLLPGLEPNGVPRNLAGTALPFRYNHLEELEAIVERCRAVAAVVMEPIRNRQPKAGFLQGAKELAEKSGSVFIFDEISAGFRMCEGGAHLLLEVDPDIAVFSKALGNGYPIAAVMGRDQVMQSAQRTFISSTYWTERIGPTAALAVIEKFCREKVHRHLMHIGQMIQDGWKEIARRQNLEIDVGGIPPLSHFSFSHEKALSMKALFVQIMLDEGILASTSFYPMFSHTESHVDRYLQHADKAFSAIADVVSNNKIESVLRGQPASPGFKRLN